MKKNAIFWASMAVFQVVFGFAVFAITRDYYTGAAGNPHAGVPMSVQTLPQQSGQFSNIDLGLLDALTSIPASLEDPAEISRLADRHFANREYAMAAQYYERLLKYGGNNAETLNNLGLTLHYIGRSEEALQRLEEGAAVDPSYQRVWLTLGFVNSDTGHRDAARTALEKAVSIDPGNSVGQSAQKMLAELE